MSRKNRSQLVPVFVTAAAGVVLFLSSSVPFAHGIDLESAKERRCEDMSSHAVSVDLGWAMSVKLWYYIHMSLYDLYSFATVLLQRNASEITEDELYYESCRTWTWNSEWCIGYGFGGRPGPSRVNYDDGLSKAVFHIDGFEEYLCWTVMTDNKTFLLQICCHTRDNQLIWTVGSPLPKLPEDTVKRIHEHVLSLGFKRKYFTGLRFETCDPFARLPDESKNEFCAKKEKPECTCQNSV